MAVVPGETREPDGRHSQRPLPMDEEIEILDAAGRPAGRAPRARAHREGLWHRAANVFLFDHDGRLLVQRRAQSKDVCPGAWDLSVAEHLEPGESYAEGAARGLREELGVSGVVLEPLGGVRPCRIEMDEPFVRDFEFQQSFRGTLDAEVVPDPQEVAEIGHCTLAELAAAMVRTPDRFTPWFRLGLSDLRLLASGDAAPP